MQIHTATEAPPAAADLDPVLRESMPSVVRAFAENQPVTSIVEAIRVLLSN